MHSFICFQVFQIFITNSEETWELQVTYFQDCLHSSNISFRLKKTWEVLQPLCMVWVVFLYQNFQQVGFSERKFFIKSYQANGFCKSSCLDLQYITLVIRGMHFEHFSMHREKFWRENSEIILMENVISSAAFLKGEIMQL